MARTITQYRIFIGSPGGLADERKLFRDAVAKFNTSHARQHQIEFEAVGWEDTLPGIGRPQAMINQDLEQCDYAIFAFHDRWGSPTGNGDLVGTEEEWQIAQGLYDEYKLLQVALFFKAVPLAQEKDPGEEYKKVLAFKRQIFDSKKHLCGSFKKPRDFGEKVEVQLAKWLADHVKTPREGSLSEPQSQIAQGAATSLAPTFAYWLTEAWKVMEGLNNDYSAGLIFANRAVNAATDENELSRALHARGYAHYFRIEYAESLASYQRQIETLAGISTGNADVRIAKALVGKGLSLYRLDRHEEAIVTYDELIKRYGDSDAELLCEQVAKALLNKGFALSQLERRYEEIAIYDDLIRRYSSSEAEPLREKVAKAFFWKACGLAFLKQVKACITTLEAWAEKCGGLDCEAIAEQGVFFKYIRDDPDFAAYLASKGCVAG